MKHLRRFNESGDTDVVEPMLRKMAKKDTKGLVSALTPYRSLLKPYYDKYFVDGEIRADLIEADIRRFNFTAKANEEYSWDEDYGDKKTNPLVLRILYKVFVRFPKTIIEIIAEWFKEMIGDFRHGFIGSGILNILIGALTALIVYVMSILAYQCGDYLFNGLDKGVAKSGAEFEPAHYETHTHHVGGKHPYTYTTHDYVPDRWHVEVQGLGEESGRVERWVTYDKSEGEGVWKGDKLVNDENWTWEITEEFK